MVSFLVQDGALPQAADLTIYKGDTFVFVVRWAANSLTTKAVTAVTKAAPPSITSATHGLTTGWKAAVASAGGMRELNARHYPPYGSEYHDVTVVDPNTVTLDGVNSTEYTAFTSGGFLVYKTPKTLTGYSGRLMVRDSAVATGVPLLSLSTEIVLDNTAKTITGTIPAATSAAFTWSSGVYDLEVYTADAVPVVVRLLSGNVVATDEVTRADT